MLALMYTLFTVVSVLFLTTGCQTIDTYVAPFEPSAEVLSTAKSPLFAPQDHTENNRHHKSDTTHVNYLNKLVGQTCTTEKWTDLVVKSLRQRPATADSTSLEQALYDIDSEDVKRGDIVYFRTRQRGPSFGVIAQTLKGGTFLGVSLIRGEIREFRLNVRRRHSRRHRGQVINSFIRTIDERDTSPGYLAGELALRFARPN
ncbi:MAG: hypothetical protein ACPGQS_15315 [Bradymonadia bacterium]